MSFSFDTGDQSPFGNTLALAPKLKYVFPRSGKLELVPHHRKLFHDQFTTKMNNVRSRIDFLCIRQVGPQANYSNRYVADKTRKLDVDAKICRRRRIVLGGNSVKVPTSVVLPEPCSTITPSQNSIHGGTVGGGRSLFSIQAE